MKIGEKIRALRKSNGLTQKQLAQKSGIAEITIRQYEKGDYEPKMEQLQKLAKGLSIPMEQLLTTEQIESRLMDEANWGLVAVLKSVYDTVDLEWEENLDCDGVLNSDGEFSVRLRKGNKVTYLTKQNWEILYSFVCQNLPLFVGMAKKEKPDEL
jgi:transcriptional regulator with XRE-family HTH domain